MRDGYGTSVPAEPAVDLGTARTRAAAHAGKAVLTVLDFIGQHRREYRFDLRYRALTGTSRNRLRQEIEHGFPFLPSGSQLMLDRVARDIVLDNIRGGAVALPARAGRRPPVTRRPAARGVPVRA